MREKLLWVRPKYLEWVLSGRKTVEVRVGYPNILRLEVGDVLVMNELHRYRIRRISAYADFEALLAAEEPTAIAPDLAAEEILPVLRCLYGAEKEALGVVALEIEPAEAGSAEA